MSQGLCPSCGAAVNLTAGQIETKCQYCDSVVTLQQAEAQFNEFKNSKIGGNMILAETYFASNQYQKALSFYDKAVEQDGMAGEAWLGRGRCLVNIQNESHAIDTTGTFSSLETAIRFAANPQLMAKRAAKVIAEAVFSGLRREKAVYQGEYNGWGGVVYRTADYNALLGWAIERGDQNEFLLKTGAEFYSRCTPQVNAHRVMNPPEGDFKEALEEFFVTVNQNADRFLKLLRQIDPEAASQCDATIQKSESTAQLQLEAKKKHRAEMESIRVDIVSTNRKMDELLKNGNKQGGCFIATACYEDYDHPVILELRNFRDNCLETFSAGRAFVRCYYKWSPPIASIVAKNGILKTLARVLIVTPAVVIAQVIQRMKFNNHN